MTGALITASFNPIIAVLTATGPLAPVHFTINWSFNIPMAIMASYVLAKKQPISFATYLTMVLVSELFLATGLIPVWLFLFKFSALQTAGLWLWAVAEAVPASLLGFALDRVSVRYATAPSPTLRDISFRVEPGEFVGIVGSTGSGKSTLLYLLAGVIPHYLGAEISGDVLIYGRRTQELSLARISERV